MRQARSDKLMQFNNLLDTPVRRKEIERAELEKDVQRYLQHGGKIEQLPHDATGYQGVVRNYNRGPQ